MNWFRIDRCDGPPCPRCGCQDVKILRKPAAPNPDGSNPWWGWGLARCNHCATEFGFREVPQEDTPTHNAADYFPGNNEVVECENVAKCATNKVVPIIICDCGTRMTVKSKDKDKKMMRYYKCKNCGKTGKRPLSKEERDEATRNARVKHSKVIDI